jgi:hypothetical protein
MFLHRFQVQNLRYRKLLVGLELRLLVQEEESSMDCTSRCTNGSKLESTQESPRRLRMMLWPPSTPGSHSRQQMKFGNS